MVICSSFALGDIKTKTVLPTMDQILPYDAEGVKIFGFVNYY